MPTSLMKWTTSFDDKLAELSSGNHTDFASFYLQNHMTYVLWLVVPPVLLVLGCYGNVMTIVVMMRAMRASESTGCLSVYFTALAVSDLFLLVTSVLWYWPEMAFDFPLDYFHDLSCMIPFFVSYVSSMTSAWFLVAMTCQRLTSVVLPHRVGVLCTVRRGRVVTCTIVTLSCLLNIHIFVNYRIEHVEGGYETCVSIDEQLVNIFSFLDLFFASLIPFLFLIIANSFLIYRAVQSANFSGKLTGKDDRHTTLRSSQLSSITTTLILTSAAFLLLSFPTCVFDIYLESVGFYEGEIADDSLNAKLALAETVCLLMWISNSAVNFYIYVLSGRKFREETKRCLRSCFRAAGKSQSDNERPT